VDQFLNWSDSRVLQQIRIVLLNLFNQLIDTILVEILIELLSNNGHHIFDVHTIQDTIDVGLLESVAVNDGHGGCVVHAVSLMDRKGHGGHLGQFQDRHSLQTW